MSDRERATGIALSLCRIYLSCKDAFPTAQMKEEWAAIVWRDACVKTGASLELFIPFELFADGNMKSFVDTKTRIMHVVEAQYGFDTSHAPDSISRNATLSQALLSDMAFVYRVCPLSSPFTTHQPSRRNLIRREPSSPISTSPRSKGYQRHVVSR
ncbi:hypothetical protein BJY52DRAFT_135046 [Lactarius psammicola]|nr:hypothetical protein BJY52DRAFT_135046 [Lactarius psammicola]